MILNKFSFSAPQEIYLYRTVWGMCILMLNSQDSPVWPYRLKPILPWIRSKTCKQKSEGTGLQTYEWFYFFLQLYIPRLEWLCESHGKFLAVVHFEDTEEDLNEEVLFLSLIVITMRKFWINLCKLTQN